MPWQNGPCYFSADAKRIADRICGLHGAWELPLVQYEQRMMMMMTPPPPALSNARYEAAFKKLRAKGTIFQQLQAKDCAGSLRVRAHTAFFFRPNFQ